MNVNAMAASQFIGPFLDTVQKWESTMHTISEVLELWLQLQKRWLYLEGIFVGGDIRMQLPEEAKRFDDIDKSFKKIMNDTSKRLNVLECCTIKGSRHPFPISPLKVPGPRRRSVKVDFLVGRSARRVRVDDKRVGQVSEIVDGLLEQQTSGVPPIHLPQRRRAVEHPRQRHTDRDPRARGQDVRQFGQIQVRVERDGARDSDGVDLGRGGGDGVQERGVGRREYRGVDGARVGGDEEVESVPHQESGVQLRKGEERHTRRRHVSLPFLCLGEEAKNGMDARFSREHGPLR